MSDIIEQLRETQDLTNYVKTQQRMQQAADEIERLRKVIQELLDFPGGMYSLYLEKKARSALSPIRDVCEFCGTAVMNNGACPNCIGPDLSNEEIDRSGRSPDCDDLSKVTEETNNG